MAEQYEVVFYDISDSRSVGDEIKKDLTTEQLVQFGKQVGRLQENGWRMSRGAFNKVQGVAETLWEWRLSFGKVEYRVLCGAHGRTFVLLCGYKEKRNDIPEGKKKSAVQRWNAWCEARGIR